MGDDNWLGEPLAQILRRALDDDSDFEELRVAYVALDKRALSSVTGDDLLKDRRAIAGGLLTVAQLKKQSLEIATPLFQSVLGFGFDDAEDDLQQVGAFARYCFNAGHPEACLQHFIHAMQRARAEFDSSSLDGYERLLQAMTTRDSKDL